MDTLRAVKQHRLLRCAGAIQDGRAWWQSAGRHGRAGRNSGIARGFERGQARCKATTDPVTPACPRKRGEDNQPIERMGHRTRRRR
jgi:hypothetical protein